MNSRHAIAQDELKQYNQEHQEKEKQKYLGKGKNK